MESVGFLGCTKAGLVTAPLHYLADITSHEVSCDKEVVAVC